jgi:DNA-binding NtrC family response regulator
MKGAEVTEVLVVDDEQSTAEYLAEVLRAEGYRVTLAFTLSEAIEILRERSFALVVSDLCLESAQGTTLLPFIKKADHPPEVIFITGYGSVETAVSALHEGAFDYISKPTDLREIEGDLKAVVARAIKHRQVMEQDPPMAPTVADGRSMVGTSPVMVRVYRNLAKASLTRENVLIAGESGTGKELVARAIHEKSSWSNQPFVTVNCCALTETLLESELFGHVRGSFTGATHNKKGLFEEADGGTLFLDEIGDISLALQVKLLRAIQEGEIKPVGSAETRKVNVRLVAATHRNLQKYVQEGKFREDLYYRLKVILIEMPPLRERQKDIPELTQFFLNRYAQKTGKRITSVAEDAMARLLQYSWPGNVRELENAIARAVAMTSSTSLFAEDFPAEIAGGGKSSYAEPVEALGPGLEGPSIEAPNVESLEDIEKRHIARTLESVNFNKSKAAEILGIDRVTLYRKAFKYGILSKGSAHTT